MSGNSHYTPVPEPVEARLKHCADGKKCAMKTLFLNPPSFHGFDGGAGARYQARREIRSFWYPDWLAQAAALVEDSRLVDAPPDNLSFEDVARISEDFELTILYTSTPSFAGDVQIAELIKQHKPSMKIGFVGPHVTALPEESLQNARVLDFVVRKEFDYAVRDIAMGKKFAEVKGISWRDGDTIRHNQLPDLIQDLDALPSVLDVYKRDLTIDNYYNGYLLHPYLSLYTGRGCTHYCTFCLWPQTVSSHRFRTRSSDSVYREFAQAIDYFPQVKEFFINDDTFTANLPRAEEIAHSLKPLGITWAATAAADVPYETLKILKECGLRILVVGYESGSDIILRNIRKGVTTQMARKFTRDCKDLGIDVHGCFILGLPGETQQTIQQTIQYACEIDPDMIQVSIAAPYPGTRFYEQALENNWLSQNDLLNAKGIQECVLNYPGLSSADINASIDRFYRQFYMRARVLYRIGRKMMRDSHERQRRFREGKEFMQYLRTRRL